MDNLCGTRQYSNITQAMIDAALAEMRRQQMLINGNNPWDINTNTHGIKLNASWNAATLELTIIVTDKNWYVPCSRIWDTIDSLVPHVQGLSDEVLTKATT